MDGLIFQLYQTPTGITLINNISSEQHITVHCIVNLLDSRRTLCFKYYLLRYILNCNMLVSIQMLANKYEAKFSFSYFNRYWYSTLITIIISLFHIWLINLTNWNGCVEVFFFNLPHLLCRISQPLWTLNFSRTTYISSLKLIHFI